MKKIISLVLALAMVLTLFAGISVSATNTTDGSVLVLTTGKPVILGGSYNYTFHAWANPEAEEDVTFTQTADFAGIGYTGGVVMDCEVPTGQQPCVRFYTVSLNPNVVINGTNDMFMMYVSMPTYIPDILPANRRWGEVMRPYGLSVSQNGTTFTATAFNGMRMRTLDSDDGAWSEVVNTGGSFGVLSGFEGYVMFDLSTLEWDKAGFDASADYTVTNFKMYNGVVGGQSGAFSVGGYYGVKVYSETAIKAQINGVPVNLALNDYEAPDSNAVTVTTTNTPEAFRNTGAYGTDDLGREYGWGVSYKSGNTYTGATIDHRVGGKALGNAAHIAYTSDVAHGYLSNNENPGFQANFKTTFVLENAKAAMIYIELPETGLGYSSFRIDGIAHDGYFWNFLRKYGYLSVDGSAWSYSTDINSNREVILPDGFKGYVKMYFDEEAYGSNGVREKRNLWYLDFSFGLFGGEYGDVIFGGIWNVINDTDSTWVKVGSNEAVKVAKPDKNSPIEANLKNPAYNGDGANSLGGTPFQISLNTANDNISLKFTENRETIGTHMMSTASSIVAVGAANGSTAAIKYVSWAKITAGQDNLMVYMEVPTHEENAAWQIKLTGLTFHQSNANVIANGQNDYYWTNSIGMQYSYLEKDGDYWVNGAISSDGNSIMTLPNGFKGYVKFDFSTCENYRGEWTNANNNLYAKKPFDYTMDYSIEQMVFTLNYMGGIYGDFVIGGAYEVTKNTNSIYAKVSNSSTYEGEAESLVTQIDENAVNLQLLRDAIALVGDIDIKDVETVDYIQGLCDIIPEDYMATLTAEEAALLESIINGFNAYRPSFLGVAVRVPDGTDNAGIKVGNALDTSAAKAEGYNAVEYGTVMLTKKYLTKDNYFTADSTGAELVAGGNVEDVLTFTWDAVYESNKWDEYEDDLFFRSYVVYSNGTNDITVWNTPYTNEEVVISTNIENPSIRLYAYRSYVSRPYLCTGIANAANRFGLSVFAGHYYGNINGDHLIDADDVVELRKVILGTAQVGEYTYIPDTNADGAVNVKDLVRFKKHLADSSVKMGASDKVKYYAKATPESYSFSLNLYGSAYDGVETQLRRNPDRGWRLEAYVNVANTSDDNQTPQSDPTFNVWNNLAKEPYQVFSPQLTQVYFYLTGYKNTQNLPQYAFDRMQAVFDKAEELGIKLVVRFAYQGEMKQGIGDAEDAIMLAHMQQLKPFLEENADLIYSIEAGFLGAWGEWHSYNKSGIEHNEKALLEGIINMVPENVYLQVRYPQILDYIDESSPVYNKLGNIGIHNDSFFGYTFNTSAWPMIPVPEGTVIPDGVTAEMLAEYEYNWNKAMQTGTYAPMGGELFWGYETTEDQYTDAYDALIQYSMFRQSVFSLYHGYKEGMHGVEGDGIFSMQDWEATPVTPEWLEANNITYDPNYFVDSNGNTVEHNVLEFITDHLGYRIALKDIDIKGAFASGSELDVNLNLVNYGFASAFNMNSGFAILDREGNVVSTVAVGNPALWHSRNPENWNDGELLTHNISSKIALPTENGTYKLAFYLKNSLGTGASLANDLEYIDGGYTVIYTFNIGGTAEEENLTTVLNFDKGMDMFGEKAVNILGDSITQGLDAFELYDNSWASLFKGALNDRVGTNNMGFVSMNYAGGSYEEIHTIETVTDTWTKHSGWNAAGTPGHVNYVTWSKNEEILRFTLDRNVGGIDRHINGFYIYYTEGPDYDTFEVKVNGQSVATVDCVADVRKDTARSQYIEIPADCGNELTIDIVKAASDVETMVMINGIAYMDDPVDSVTVNNYSLSGVRLVEYSDTLIEELSKANVVICTLGTNDAGTEADLDTFKHKLNVLAESCKKNGSTLIVGDVIWRRYGNDEWATAYKNALKSAAARANGYFIDFTPLEVNCDGFLYDDICHPSILGHRLMAEYFCEQLGLTLN